MTYFIDGLLPRLHQVVLPILIRVAKVATLKSLYLVKFLILTRLPPTCGHSVLHLWICSSQHNLRSLFSFPPCHFHRICFCSNILTSNGILEVAIARVASMHPFIYAYEQVTMWITYIELTVHICPQSAKGACPPSSRYPLICHFHPMLVCLPSLVGPHQWSWPDSLDRFYNRLKRLDYIVLSINELAHRERLFIEANPEHVLQEDLLPQNVNWKHDLDQTPWVCPSPEEWQKLYDATFV